MSVRMHNVKGYEDYQKKVDELSKSNVPVYYWYIGARLENGQSWCGDCRDSEPIIKEHLDLLKLKEDIIVVCVEIEREDFKGPDCAFRKDEAINVCKVPTLFCPSFKKSLVETDCMDKNKLDLFFEEAKQG